MPDNEDRSAANAARTGFEAPLDVEQIRRDSGTKNIEETTEALHKKGPTLAACERTKVEDVKTMPADESLAGRNGKGMDPSINPERSGTNNEGSWRTEHLSPEIDLLRAREKMLRDRPEDIAERLANIRRDDPEHDGPVDVEEIRRNLVTINFEEAEAKLFKESPKFAADQLRKKERMKTIPAEESIVGGNWKNMDLQRSD